MDLEIFKKGLDELNIEVTERQIVQFKTYSQLLKEWNQKMNLTAITDDEGISVKHFLDCILPLKYIKIPENATMVDVGTGAGFPGFPIKIMRADIKATLIDSLKKRVTFLEEVSAKCSIADIECIHGRAEDLGKDKKLRESFDIVVSRAVANLRVLSEYSLPFVKCGGMFVALKAEGIDEELAEAKAMIGNLGGKVAEVISAPLPESDIVRKLVVIKKEKETPKQFPRKPNKIL